MRDYGKDLTAFWTDHLGRKWAFIKSRRRLKFKYPLHAALRAFIHYRDKYQCQVCGYKPKNIPENYDGRYCIDLLVIDHVLTLKAGGESHPDNLQTLCGTCNRKKISIDNENSRKFLEIPRISNKQEVC